MSGGIGFEPWEPEETVGKIWHRLARGFDAPERHEEACVALAGIAGRLAVFFRALGGDPSVEIRAVADERSHHRLSLRRRLGTDAETCPRASLDEGALRLPATLAVFPAREANAALYLWLAAASANARPVSVHPADPLAKDLAGLREARETVAATLEEAPGLAPLYADLCAALLALRPRTALPATEAAVEALVRKALGDPAPLSPLAERLGRGECPPAPRSYRRVRPVPLWPDLRQAVLSAPTEVETRTTEGPPEETGEEKALRARRQKSDQAERKDSFILHKFEAILSWAEFLNLNRRIEDDDSEDAKKAAEDQDEIGLGQVSKAPATRLKLHLDLSPEEADREALSGAHLYPEWEARRGAYLPGHARVLASTVAPEGEALPWRDEPRARRRIAAVRRQFEALRPGRVSTAGHREGDELDIEAAVRSRVELRANGAATDRIWRQSRPVSRDLAVSILLDVSRSTESAVDGQSGRTVIEIERETLAALAWGLDACGDEVSIRAFSSLRRNRVFVLGCKEFAEPMGPVVEARIAALRPGHYTRLGTAIRHVSAELAACARKRRLLLVITDGKPNDLDHYEGRHGVEDSRKAVAEARRAGHAVHGITVDRTARAQFARIFGQSGHTVIPHPDRLTQALPEIYRHLTGA